MGNLVVFANFPVVVYSIVDQKIAEDGKFFSSTTNIFTLLQLSVYQYLWMWSKYNMHIVHIIIVAQKVQKIYKISWNLNFILTVVSDLIDGN